MKLVKQACPQLTEKVYLSDLFILTKTYLADSPGRTQHSPLSYKKASWICLSGQRLCLNRQKLGV